MELTEVGELDGVLFGVSDHIARITLNRPERGNALTAPMMQWFRSVWHRVAEDPDIRCVLITGAGVRHFCTGADLNAVAEAGSVGAGLGRATQEVFFTSRQNNVWKPTVCAVNGWPRVVDCTSWWMRTSSSRPLTRCSWTATSTSAWWAELRTSASPNGYP